MFAMPFAANAASSEQTANTNPVVYSDGQSVQISSSYTQDELNQIRNIHNEVVKKGLVTLNADGTITVNVNATVLGVDEGMFEEYIKSVNNIDDIIKLGGVYFDKNFNLQVDSTDQIAKIIYDQDQKMRQSTIVTPELKVTYTLPTLYAYNIARSNKSELKAFYQAIYVFRGPIVAYSATVGYWIGKVREGGAWDYKVVSGYAPYNKQWSAVQRYTTSTKTSEWFGNYNYGFTGRYLFSLSILLAGGDGVSYIFHHTMDDQQDKIDVTQGYNESAGV